MYAIEIITPMYSAPMLEGKAQGREAGVLSCLRTFGQRRSCRLREGEGWLVGQAQSVLSLLAMLGRSKNEVRE
jgi:hypothetical protein